MDCERDGCGHPLGFHDPCSKCDCATYEPPDRKARVAALTDIVERGKTIRQQRAHEKARLS